MFLSSALLSLLLLALSTVNATPIIRDGSSSQLFTLASKINPIGATSLAQIDRTRTSRLLANVNASAKGKRAADPVFAMNAIVSYTASVGVGSPAVQCESGDQCP
jgi:saccharopepsin